MGTNPTPRWRNSSETGRTGVHQMDEVRQDIPGKENLTERGPREDDASEEAAEKVFSLTWLVQVSIA